MAVAITDGMHMLSCRDHLTASTLVMAGEVADTYVGGAQGRQ